MVASVRVPSLALLVSLSLSLSLPVVALGQSVYDPPPVSSGDLSRYPSTVRAANLDAELSFQGPVVPFVNFDPNWGAINVSSPSGTPGSDFTPSLTNVGDIALAVDGWGINHKTGAVPVSVRQNIVGDDGTIIDPQGTAYPGFFSVAYASTQFSSGGSFNTVSGSQTNGNGAIDMVLHSAGIDAEGVFNTSYAYFPYAEGWIGGNVQGSLDADPSTGVAAWEGGTFDPAAFDRNNPSTLPSYNVEAFTGDAPVVFPTIGEGKAVVDLSELGLSPETGMLFVWPTEGGTFNNIASGTPTTDNSGWDVIVREDGVPADDPNSFRDFDQPTVDPFDIDSNNSDFGMLYVGYDYDNLIGGYIAGDGSIIQEAEDDPNFDGEFTVERLGTGEYAIEVTIDGVTQTEDDGMLILSVAELEDNPDDNGPFASYEFDPATGRFILNTRQVVNPILSQFTPPAQLIAETSDPNTRFPLIDANFYFAWVDFENPLSLPSAVTPPPSGVIPEPSSVLIFVVSGGLLLARRRRASF